MRRFKDILLGILIGAMVFAPLAWAASRITLVNGSGVEMGTSASPLIVKTN